MADVFLSYSRNDRPIAQAIALELQRLNVDVWWDHELLGGDDYRQKISEILVRVPVAIVIWSKRSTESQWVVGEASAAREGKTLIPLNIDGCDPPLDFRAVHTIDFSDWILGDQLPKSLVAAIAGKLGRDLSYTMSAEERGFGRLVRSTARSWYRDAESLLFYYIGQGFACSLCMTPLAVYRSQMPTWIALFIAVMASAVVSALQMRPVLESRRMGVALLLFVIATLLGLVCYYSTSALYNQLAREVFLTVTGFWTLALLFSTDIARRATSRN